MDTLLSPLRFFTLHQSLFTRSLALVVCWACVNFAQGLDDKTLKEVEKKMEEQKIKEILEKPAEYLIDLSFGNGKYNVKAGDKVDINKVFEKPSTVSWDAESGEWFTLVLYDYDAPERRMPALRSFIHWMIGNIPEKSLTAGNTFYDYYGLKLFEKGDVHRYMMIVYKQKEKITAFREPFINSETDALRARFNRTEFENKYDLGPPYAFTFFTSEIGKS